MINSLIKCPYCNLAMEINSADLYLEDGFDSYITCNNCLASFAVKTKITYSFKPRRLSCDESGDHFLKPLFSEEKHISYKRFYCEDCNKIIEIEDIELIPQLLDTYNFESWIARYIEIIAEKHPELMRTYEEIK